MAEEGGLEKKLKGYKASVAIGQASGLASTYFGITNVGKIADYVPGIRSMANTVYGLPVIGAMANFIGDQVGFAASLYAYNRETYKGLSGKFSFIKDYASLGSRHLGSYLISYPLAIAASTAAIATGLLSGVLSTTVPYVLESLITGIGYMFSTRKYRERLAAQPA